MTSCGMVLPLLALLTGLRSIQGILMWSVLFAEKFVAVSDHAISMAA